MINTRSNSPQSISFDRLMRLGQVAHHEGDERTAHNYWQRAAMLRPDNEQVWTALMWVIDNDEDRKVCLMNILTINPNNTNARQLLDDLIGETQPQDNFIVADVTPETPRNVDYLRIIVLGSIFGIGIGIIIVLLQMLII